MKYDVFISYSRKDYVDEDKQVISGNIISQIKELLDAHGISYWFDEEGVFSGDAFAPVIARNIKESKIFLFISSEHSNASEWTSNEIATAHAYKKKIIPFRYDDSIYNDSVIIYIARLDYIEYKSNPSKSLNRLLLSIQSYLKEESEKRERERLEEERRRNAEISKKERAIKLQQIRERIENLENRKFDLEKEILSQEKSLTDLRNEKRIIESNIIDLQEEEATLLGYNRMKSQKENDEKTNVRTRKSQDTNRNRRTSKFTRKCAELKQEMALKHWIINSIYIMSGVVFAIFGMIYLCVGLLESSTDILCACMALFCVSIAIILSIYRTLKNRRDGIVWLLISFVCANITGLTAQVDSYYDYYRSIWHFIGRYVFDTSEFEIAALWMGIYVITILLCSLFIRKNGQSAWSLMQKRTLSRKSDILYIVYIVCIIATIMATISTY